MVGALVLAFLLVVAMPVAIVMSGAVAAALLGKLADDDARARAGDSVYTDLNT